MQRKSNGNKQPQMSWTENKQNLSLLTRAWNKSMSALFSCELFKPNLRLKLVKIVHANNTN